MNSQVLLVHVLPQFLGPETWPDNTRQPNIIYLLSTTAPTISHWAEKFTTDVGPRRKKKYIFESNAFSNGALRPRGLTFSPQDMGGEVFCFSGGGREDGDSVFALRLSLNIFLSPNLSGLCTQTTFKKKKCGGTCGLSPNLPTHLPPFLSERTCRQR